MTRRFAPALLAGVLALGLASCSETQEAVSVTAGPTANAAPANGSAVDAETFAEAAKMPGTTIIDVRTPAEFAEGHLEGAVNVDIEGPDFQAQVAQLDPAAPYAVYCRSGNRSGAAVAFMTANGFSEVYHLSGGIGAWEQAGGEFVIG